jgi:hypothetical protein
VSSTCRLHATQSSLEVVTPLSLLHLTIVRSISFAQVLEGGCYRGFSRCREGLRALRTPDRNSRGLRSLDSTLGSRESSSESRGSRGKKGKKNNVGKPKWGKGSQGRGSGGGRGASPRSWYACWPPSMIALLFWTLLLTIDAPTVCAQTHALLHMRGLTAPLMPLARERRVRLPRDISAREFSSPAAICARLVSTGCVGGEGGELRGVCPVVEGWAPGLYGPASSRASTTTAEGTWLASECVWLASLPSRMGYGGAPLGASSGRSRHGYCMRRGGPPVITRGMANRRLEIGFGRRVSRSTWRWYEYLPLWSGPFMLHQANCVDKTFYTAVRWVGGVCYLFHTLQTNAGVRESFVEWVGQHENSWIRESYSFLTKDLRSTGSERKRRTREAAPTPQSLGWRKSPRLAERQA